MIGLFGTRGSLIRIAALVVTLAGCASGPAGDATRPVVTIAQSGPLGTMRAAQETKVPVDFRLEVTNPLEHPITLLSVEIETVGNSGGYSMSRVRHKFDQTIGAHAKATIDLRAWVQPLQVTEGGQVMSPVTIIGSAKFDAGGRSIQSSFVNRIVQ